MQGGSAACQRKTWKCGHKQDCRKKGQIEVGLDAALSDLSSRKCLNGCFVKVIRPGATGGKWLVKLADSFRSMFVSADKLVQLRPKDVDSFD